MSQVGHNLFYVDIDAVAPRLETVNASLMTRVQMHLTEGRALFREGVSEGNLARFEQFVCATKALKKEIRAARLNDARPFSKAKSAVEGWFKDPETRLKTAEMTMRDMVNAYVKLQHLRSATPKSDAENARAEKSDNDAAKSRTSAPLPMPKELAWFVEGFDLEALDLNALKPFLTEAALRAALKKHLEAYGPNALPGVTYAEGLP